MPNLIQEKTDEFSDFGRLRRLRIGTRIVSLALIPVLLGATWAHSGNGWSFSGEGGGWEYPLFWTVAQVAVVLLGSGAYAMRVPALDKALGQFA